MLETGALRHSSIGFLGCGDLNLSHAHKTVRTRSDPLCYEQGNELRS
jgi:hypothetical protein